MPGFARKFCTITSCVPVAPVQVADLEQRFGALPIGLADADEDACRERHGEPAGILDRAQPYGRHLVRRSVMQAALRGQTGARGLEHHAHRGAHVLQAGDLLVAHDARVEVGQQAVSSITRIATARR